MHQDIGILNRGRRLWMHKSHLKCCYMYFSKLHNSFTSKASVLGEGD